MEVVWGMRGEGIAWGECANEVSTVVLSPQKFSVRRGQDERSGEATQKQD